jgi:hypothetical protein
MIFRRINRQHVAAIVRKLAYADATPERSAELLAALRKYNPRDVAALFEGTVATPSPAPPTINLDEIVKHYGRPAELFRLAYRIIERARQLEGKSRVIRDHRNPYREGGGLKQRITSTAFETKICQHCRRAFLSRRADAKTCSPRCRTALHRKQSQAAECNLDATYSQITQRKQRQTAAPPSADRPGKRRIRHRA